MCSGICSSSCSHFVDAFKPGWVRRRRGQGSSLRQLPLANPSSCALGSPTQSTMDLPTKNALDGDHGTAHVPHGATHLVPSPQRLEVGSGHSHDLVVLGKINERTFAPREVVVTLCPPCMARHKTTCHCSPPKSNDGIGSLALHLSQHALKTHGTASQPRPTGRTHNGASANAPVRPLHLGLMDATAHQVATHNSLHRRRVSVISEPRLSPVGEPQGLWLARGERRCTVTVATSKAAHAHNEGMFSQRGVKHANKRYWTRWEGWKMGRRTR